MLINYFATCARNIEPVLADELHALGARDIELGRGGVRFRGDRLLLYKANLWVRSAIRILQPILHAAVHNPDDLYEAVRTLDWTKYMTPDHTLAVDCNVRDSGITHSKYAALRTKDAICDQFVDKCGRRPSVDVETPMVGLNLHIYRDEATLSLDSSGDSLHKRGYRPVQTRAPINESLAAALLMLAGYDGSRPLADPMCGGGTLAIEAAWLATRRPPGLTRRRFGFQGWLDFDIRAWTEMRDAARAQVLRTLDVGIAASDERNDAVAMCRDNAKAAGVGHLLQIERCQLPDFRPPAGPPGLVICNPPYGERLGEEKHLRGLYELMGRVLREHCRGWRAAVFTGNPRLAECLGMQPRRSISLFNGKIPCQLLLFDLK